MPNQYWTNKRGKRERHYATSFQKCCLSRMAKPQKAMPVRVTRLLEFPLRPCSGRRYHSQRKTHPHTRIASWRRTQSYSHSSPRRSQEHSFLKRIRFLAWSDKRHKKWSRNVLHAHKTNQHQQKCRCSNPNSLQGHGKRSAPTYSNTKANDTSWSSTTSHVSS